MLRILNNNDAGIDRIKPITCQINDGINLNLKSNSIIQKTMPVY